jgi:hypothetical protein
MDAHARSLVTNVVEPVLNELVRQLQHHASDSFVQIAKIDISVFIDPEEDAREVVVTEWIRARPSFALDYWDRLGSVLTQWILGLPDHLQEIAYDRITVAVQSAEN